MTSNNKIFNSLTRLGTFFVSALMMMSFIIAEPVAPYTIKLPAGTLVPLETTQMISTETLQVGQTVDLRVTSDVKVDGKVVIPAGSIAKGQVSRADKPKAIGKEGRLEIQIKSVRAIDGQEIPLSGGSIFREGTDKQTLAIVLGIFICLLCLLIKGKDAVVPIGTSVSSNVASNYEIEVK